MCRALHVPRSGFHWPRTKAWRAGPAGDSVHSGHLGIIAHEVTDGVKMSRLGLEAKTVLGVHALKFP